MLNNDFFLIYLYIIYFIKYRRERERGETQLSIYLSVCLRPDVVLPGVGFFSDSYTCIYGYMKSRRDNGRKYFGERIPAPVSLPAHEIEVHLIRTSVFSHCGHTRITPNKKKIMGYYYSKMFAQNLVDQQVRNGKRIIIMINPMNGINSSRQMIVMMIPRMITERMYLSQPAFETMPNILPKLNAAPNPFRAKLISAGVSRRLNRMNKAIHTTMSTIPTGVSPSKIDNGPATGLNTRKAPMNIARIVGIII